MAAITHVRFHCIPEGARIRIVNMVVTTQDVLVAKPFFFSHSGLHD